MNFKNNDVVTPSGQGKTTGWNLSINGVVVGTTERYVRVQWDNSPVEDELQPYELVNTGETREPKVRPILMTKEEHGK